MTHAGGATRRAGIGDARDWSGHPGVAEALSSDGGHEVLILSTGLRPSSRWPLRRAAL